MYEKSVPLHCDFPSRDFGGLLFKAVFCASLALWTAGDASAQDTAFGGDGEEQDTENPLVLDAIVVTSRKIEEPLREVPFGVSVFDAEDIRRRDLDNQRTFGRSVPGFNLVDTGLRGSSIPNIRGVGSFLPLSSDDGSVPVFIDGIPVAQRSQDREFFDITRIEVLRGPQNTLYGRNAQAGAIGITTADPVFERQFEIGAEVGNLGAYRTNALMNVPLSSSAALRVAAQYDTRDGDIRDINLGRDVRGSDIVNLHSKLLLLPDDATDITLAFRYGYYDEEPTLGAFVENPEFPQLFSDSRSFYEQETIGAGLTIRRDLGRFELSSLTGYQNYQLDFGFDDTDGLATAARTGLPPETFNNPNVDRREVQDEGYQFSQEFRLNGELGNGINVVAGAAYFRSELDFDILFNATGFIDANFDNSFQTDSYGIFGEATVPLTDRLRLIGGLRYTREERDFKGNFTDLSGSGPVASASEADDKAFNLFTGRAALSFDLTPTLTSFASVSRGAKAGGFQLIDTNVALGFPSSTFEEALTWTYEIGLRGALLDNRVFVSTSTFFNDTKDENLQVFDLTNGESTIENADTETFGLELEAEIKVTDRFTLAGGLALLETKITESEDPAVPEDAELPFSPSVAYNIAATYEQPLTLFAIDGEAFGRFEYQFVGERTIDPQNRLDLDKFDVVNLRAGWDAENFSIYAFAENLLDDTDVETSFLVGATPNGSPVSLGVPTQPRRFGVGVTLRF